MDQLEYVSTGIKGLDQAIDRLRPGDTVTWQMENIGDYMYVATQFVVDEALTGRPMVYLRFGDHDELIPTEVLQARGARIKKITLDPSVGFETFALNVLLGAVHSQVDGDDSDQGLAFVFGDALPRD